MAGFELPSPTSPAEQARALMARKDALEAELRAQGEILASQSGATMSSPLVDAEGFPRADIDIYAVRGARVRIIQLRNDLTAVVDALALALQGVYDPALRIPAAAPAASSDAQADLPFAKVNGVLSGSPAAEAGLQTGDLVTKFGHLTHTAFASGLGPLGEFVAANENRVVTIHVLRSGTQKTLNFTPRKGWGGRGLLGCHIVPYAA